MEKVKNNIIQFQNRYGVASNSKTLLFIMAKTYGASKKFMQEHKLEEKLKYKVQDIIYLYKADQLRGIDKEQIQIISMPRHEESKNNISVKKMITSRGLYYVSVARFLARLNLVDS